jgi:hypothetical protein
MPPGTGTNNPLNRTCSALLFSDIVEEKRNKMIFLESDNME